MRLLNFEMMTNLQNTEPLTNDNNLNLYATLSIFVTKAPRLMDCIQETIKSENITELEEYAAKLIIFSDNAQLEGFTQRVKNLIIAARENNFHIAEKEVESLRESFEKMTKMVCSAI
ncbi:MAG: hypothetical protein A2Y10_15910 [Planctomycetes bacterium GWF2_41_51]|nr:MAG: hypothetical protein A2Y10_15910 [Planctomycetes bacterium GWF2_41_51]HBG27582.1 hypothetical protein [Phycisphaerales bacterium]